MFGQSRPSLARKLPNGAKSTAKTSSNMRSSRDEGQERIDVVAAPGADFAFLLFEG